MWLVLGIPPVLVYIACSVLTDIQEDFTATQEMEFGAAW